LSTFHVRATTGSFVQTGVLPTVRRSHTATLLADGKVLVAGGINGNFTTLTNAEIFDPRSRTWTPTGAMVAFRNSASPTSLSGGKVLVVGGFSFMDEFALSSAELFDPVDGTWSATGALSTSRGRQTATPLASGKVLVAGGEDGSSFMPTMISSAELYDPV